MLQPQQHGVLLLLAGNDEAEATLDAEVLRNLRQLLRPHEHALDLGCLVRAPHPSGDTRAAITRRRQRLREVTRGEAKQRIVAIEAGYDDLADFSFSQGVARAWTHDLEQEAVIDREAFPAVL